MGSGSTSSRETYRRRWVFDLENFWLADLCLAVTYLCMALHSGSDENFTYCCCQPSYSL